MSALFALAARALADSPEPPTHATFADTDPRWLDDADDLLGTIHDELARLDAGAARPEDEDAALAASGLVDITSIHDIHNRYRRPSPWGRVDVSVLWRRIERTDEPQRDEVLLVATWRH